MKKLKQAIVAVVLLLVGSGGGYVAYQNFGGSYIPTSQTLLGTSSNLCKVPIAYYFDDSTSTAGYTDGCNVNQLINTEGIDKVRFNVKAKGGTATSTLYARVMYSQDGTNYFDSATSTKSGATSTASLEPSIYALDPGIATTSVSYLFDIQGVRYTRVILYGEDVSTDPNDGVKAWIDAINLTPFVR